MEQGRLLVAETRRPVHDLVLESKEAETIVPLPPGSSVSDDPFPIVARSPAMLSVLRTIDQIAPTNANVLITGEPGTGKKSVARLIHRRGINPSGPFVALHGAAIPEHFFESDIYAQDPRDSNGGSTQTASGLERAAGGTLFLDEVGEMSLPVQAKLLRVIHETEGGHFGRIGPGRADVRVVAALSRDPIDLVAQGRFRGDLYYRLAVITIHLPRLADRGEDLILLASHFLAEFGRLGNKLFSGLSENAVELLRRHEWTGNVRELRNVIERAALLAGGGVIRPEHLPEEWRQGGRAPAANPTQRTLRDVEAQHIADVLGLTSGQIGEAARILGVHRNTLTRKIRQYRLQHPGR
jgi:DNA-binding NtrC family response regulator